jgi:hypothetical protein
MKTCAPLKTIPIGLFSLFSVMITQSANAASEFLPFEEWKENFYPFISETLEEDNGPGPKKRSTDPLAEMLFGMRKINFPTPENLRHLENQKQKEAKRFERDQDSPWSEVLKNGQSIGNLSLSPVYTTISSESGIPYSGAAPSIRLSIRGSKSEIADDGGDGKMLSYISFGGGPELTESVNGLSAVQVHAFISGGVQFFRTPDSLEPNDRRIGVAWGVYGDAEMSSTALALTSGTAIAGFHFGIDLHRLLIPKNSGVTMFQFQPTIAFFGSSFDINEKLPGEKNTDSIYYVSTRSAKFRPSYGMLGKLIVRPGVMIDVLWLQANAVNPDDMKNWDHGTNGQKMLKSSVMVRVGKRFALKGSYQWTSVKSMYRDRDGILSNSDMKVEQASLGLNFLFAND